MAERKIPSLLVACEDSVLLQAVQRVISWRRPEWLVDTVVGPDLARAKLEDQTYDVVVVCLEVDSPAGGETLRAARTLCPAALRVAYTAAPCDHPELDNGCERVTGNATMRNLLFTLDRAVERTPPGGATAARPAVGA